MSSQSAAAITEAQFLADYPEVQEVVYSEPEIQKRVQEIATQINKDYAGKSLVVVGILKGAFMYMADLVKRIRVDYSIDFMALSSYSGSTRSGIVRIVMDMRQNIEGKHVLIVEDIVDSGYTLKFLNELLQTRNPASIKTTVFLRKPECVKTDVALDYLGFDIKNEWVVGYGLDYSERLRCLPFVGILKPEVYKGDGDA
eukprot:CAMPEP_0177659654 /NCGR_PEP_ID=MMETSP0447-20121125/17567_1 /TAXON_ID=0 /ORGANISM="Stygamoeba regulata, Strain BSH-02190019" /LENGTH=198 /DNA_ID=CAMNT_0019164557 /DNA_START=36 /DNA_END=632 /DNA_ORIENTATION=+